MKSIKQYLEKRKAKKAHQKRREKILAHRQEELKKESEQNTRPIHKKKKKEKFFLGMFFNLLKKEESNKKKSKYWLTFGSIFFIFILFVFFFITPFFDISDIRTNIQNHYLLNSEKIQEFMIQYKGKSIIFTHSSTIENDVKKEFQGILNIQCKKTFPKILDCEIQEYKSAIILHKGDSEDIEYIINQVGKIIAIRPKTNDDRYITIKTSNQEIETEIGSQVLTQKLIEFIYLAKNKFESKIGVPVTGIWWLDKERELHLYTDQFPIYLSLMRDLNTQLNDLVLVFAHHEFKDKIEYIDLRIENKVFIK